MIKTLVSGLIFTILTFHHSNYPIFYDFNNDGENEILRIEVVNTEYNNYIEKATLYRNDGLKNNKFKEIAIADPMTAISETYTLKIPYGYIINFEFKHKKLICTVPCITDNSKVVGNITIEYTYDNTSDSMEAHKILLDKSLKKELMQPPPSQ